MLLNKCFSLSDLPLYIVERSGVTARNKIGGNDGEFEIKTSPTAFFRIIAKAIARRATFNMGNLI